MKTRFILLMGVSGCGKTTIGKALAKSLSWNFYDADYLHPPENIDKMKNSIPLNDEDRSPWLEELHNLILASTHNAIPGVMACSALKERYRQILLKDCQEVLIVYLKGNYELIWSRMAGRSGHYMKPEMLRSQFDALQEPQNALVIDVADTVEDILVQLLSYLENEG